MAQDWPSSAILTVTQPQPPHNLLPQLGVFAATQATRACYGLDRVIGGYHVPVAVSWAVAAVTVLVAVPAFREADTQERGATPTTHWFMSAPQSARSNVYKAYSHGEMWADISAHAVGVTCGLVGALVLMLTAGASGSFLLILGASLYAAGLLSMLGFSAAYNLWPPSPAKEMLRRFDHAAIFVMIAGTITPFVMNRVGGAWGFGLLAFAWSVAVAGVAMKLVFPRRWERATIALYIGLGLSILVVADPLARSISATSAWLLFAGSVTYILGVVFHLWERLPYQNAIWHWMVLTAAVLHYSAVLNEISAAAV